MFGLKVNKYFQPHKLWVTSIARHTFGEKLNKIIKRRVSKGLAYEKNTFKNIFNQQEFQMFSLKLNKKAYNFDSIAVVVTVVR